MANNTLTFPITEELDLPALGRQYSHYYCPSEALLIRPIYIIARGVITATESFLSFTPESEVVPHEYCFASGAVSFWDNEREDIYSFDDGQKI